MKQNETSAVAQTRTFIIDGVVLKKVENFKYLGRQIKSRDSDALALLMNVTKAQKCFAYISNLIARKGTDSAIGGRIYVAVVSAVLLYGSETWVWISSMLNIIRGFHHRACWQLTDKRPTRQQNGTY